MSLLNNYKAKLVIALIICLAALFTLKLTDTFSQPDMAFTKLSNLESQFSYINSLDEKIIYATSGNSDRGIWVNNGITTTLLKGLDSTIGENIECNFVKLNNKLYFVLYIAETGREIWETDGTVSGTKMLMDLTNDEYDGVTGQLYVYGNLIYFRGNNGEHGYEPMFTDGTVEGTKLIKDLVVGEQSSEITYIGNLGEEIFFSYDVPSVGYRLWKTDGTADGTTMVKDVAGSISDKTIVFNNKLYFAMQTIAEGTELWVTDGTSEGTHILKDIKSGNGDSYPENFVVYKDKLYFNANITIEENTVDQVYETDGTEEGTIISTAFSTKGITRIDYPIVYNDNIYFKFNTPEYGTELYRSDATVEGTYMLKDLVPGVNSSEPYLTTLVHNKLYFITFASDILENGYSYDLWVTDGTEEGTTKLKTHLGFSLGGPMPIYSDGTYLYYQQANSTNDYMALYWDGSLELWKYGQEEASYRVTFKDYDGTILKTEEIGENSSATPPTNPTREGYTFIKWVNSYESITEDTVVIASYSINSYIVEFRDYDGIVLKIESVEYGSGVTPPTNPSREGYIFEGWDKDYTKISTDTVITAVYTIKPVIPTTVNNTNEEPEIVINDITKSITEKGLKEILKNIKVYNKDNTLINMYDINLILSGVKVQPNGYIEVKIPLTSEHKDYENLRIVYINEQNEVEIIPHKIQDNYIVFSVNHFSNYAVIGTKVVKVNIDNKEEETNTSKDSTTSSINMPLVFGITLTVLFAIFIIIKRKKKTIKKKSTNKRKTTKKQQK